MPLLAEVLTELRMRRHADARSWRLGEEYLVADAVTELDVEQYQLSAVVDGTQPYDVELSVTNQGTLAYECTCPYHQDAGVFCKHLVAAGLAYLRQPKIETIVVPRGSAMDTIQKHLETCTKEQLITLLMAQSLENEALRRHLLWLASPNDELPRPRLVFRPIQ